MHEMAIIQSLLDLVLEEATKARASKVVQELNGGSHA